MKDLEIIVQRLPDDGEATLGYLSTESLACFSLEDQPQDVKVAGETRIPAGRYEIIKRQAGRFYKAYLEKWLYDFVMELADVPGFTDILIHTGNTDDHTAGCLLVGMRGSLDGRATVGSSYDAYKRLWNVVNRAFRDDRRVWIEIRDPA